MENMQQPKLETRTFWSLAWHRGGSWNSTDKSTSNRGPVGEKWLYGRKPWSVALSGGTIDGFIVGFIALLWAPIVLVFRMAY